MNVNGKPRTYRVYHESPYKGEYTSTLRFIFLPYGNSYGDIPRNAGHGDKIRFLNDDEASIISTCVCDMATKLFRVLTMMRYGTTPEQLLKAWRNRADTLGARYSAINDKECLMIWHSRRLF